MTALPKEKPHYLGHRERLRERFLQGGPDALVDYELLELVLFLAIPRGDVKPIAKDLLKKFGGLPTILAASPDELTQVSGIGESAALALKSMQAIALRMLKQEVIGKPILGSWRQVLDYCQAAMAHEKTEQVRLMFVDAKNQLIAEEVQKAGTVDHTPIYAREVVKKALHHHANAVILVHNHPTGDPSPSKEDISITKELAKALDIVGISLHDHIIIGKGDHVSMKALQVI